MKKFDWEECKSRTPKPIYDFLFEWHDKFISEGKFIWKYRQLRELTKKRPGSEKRAKRTYKHLQEHFGFFQNHE